MTAKRPRKDLSESEAAYRPEDVGLTEAEMDAWGERNKDALQATSIARARNTRGDIITRSKR